MVAGLPSVNRNYLIVNLHRLPNYTHTWRSKKTCLITDHTRGYVASVPLLKLWGFATNKDKRWLILKAWNLVKVIVGYTVWTGYIVFQFIVSYPVLFCFFHHWQWEGLLSTHIYNIPALIQWWSNKYLLFSNIDKITFFFLR